MIKGPVLVIDAGSSRLRCHIFDGEGTIVASSATEWAYLEEPDAPSMARSFDPQQLWDGICLAIRQCAADAPTSLGVVSCIAVTSQRQGVVFLDAAGNEIYAGPNMDLRAVFEGAAIDEEFREHVYGVTGHLPSFFFTPAKLRWFQQKRPKSYGRIATVLTLADWLAWRLTGVVANEVTLAGEAGLLDIGSRQWCNGLLRELELPERTGPLVKSGDVAGNVSGHAASATGLAVGVPVTIAGADTQCGLLGMGVAETGHVGIVAGWSAPVQMVTAQPKLSPEMRTWAGCHVLDDGWVAESSAGDTGNAYQWLADTVYGDRSDPFADMAIDASFSGSGANGAVAFMGYGAMDMGSVGMTYGGLMFPVPLNAATGKIQRKDLARAALESTAYAIRANIEQLEAVTGQSAMSISLGGGMTRTAAFPKILVDVLGRDVLLSSLPDATAIGTFLCAKTVLGDFRDLREAAAHARSDMRLLQPDARNAAQYEEYYKGWIRLSESLRNIEL